MKINIKKLVIGLIAMITLIGSVPYKIMAASYNQITINANKATNNGITNFPQSYQILLKELIKKTGHTNWKFKAFYTDIDWNELVRNESNHLHNTIYKSETSPYEDSWYCSCGQEGDKNFYCASEKIIKYYLDPRNFLTEITIFQFLDLSSASKVSISEIEKAVDGTFLDGQAGGMRYAKMIYDAQEKSGENAYSIIIKIFQELGSGKEGEIPYVVSGKDEDYPNVYNFFNYGATDGEGNIKRALEFAKNKGWTTPYKAMVEGAELISNSYIKQGQNTKYTFKFDVVGSSFNDLYKHQYMTNIEDPKSQSQMLYNTYKKNNYLNRELTFVIPVYKNMPTYNKLPHNQTGNLYYVSSNYGGVYLRTGPGGANSGYANIALLKKDTVVTMLQSGINGWAKVSYNDKVGYISEEYLTKVNTIKDTYKVPNQNELPFIDIDANQWYYESVKYCYNNKLILGTSENKFDPNGKLTRGMLVTILWRMEGSPKITNGKRFSDVKSDQYYYNAINWASSKQIVNGYESGKFGPNDNITREQLVVMLRNYAIYKKKNVSSKVELDNYKDSYKVSDYAKSAISWAISNKIISGKSNGTVIDPHGKASRAEIAAMINNYCINVK